MYWNLITLSYPIYERCINFYGFMTTYFLYAVITKVSWWSSLITWSWSLTVKSSRHKSSYSYAIIVSNYSFSKSLRLVCGSVLTSAANLWLYIVVTVHRLLRPKLAEACNNSLCQQKAKHTGVFPGGSATWHAVQCCNFGNLHTLTLQYL